MKCPHCGYDTMQPGRAENRRFNWHWPMPVQVNPQCWFVADDGSIDAAVVLRSTNPQAFRCPKCRTIVVIGEQTP